MSALKNLPASVKARLETLAGKRGEEFNLLLTRYGIERLLYRLSQSQHADKFLLKGAMLFAIWDIKTHRPTQDLDLLGFGPTEKEELARVFREVLQTPVPADGLVFDPDSVRAEEIREDNAYGGIRVRLIGRLGKAKVPIQIDVGAGDMVTPAPESSVFPALLDFPAPHIRSYSVYTVVAEKFEAMVKLGITNSRMKDFYDLWFLSRRFEFDGDTLRQAIHATFARRQTSLTMTPYPLTEAFSEDVAKQTQWTGFLRRNRLSGPPPDFAGLMAQLRQFLNPTLWSGKPASRWIPASGWESYPDSQSG
jgi:predicted nucleotidyltransferase component of viral defense system